MSGNSGGNRKHMSTWKKLSGVVAAGALMLALAGTAFAGADPVWATVTGHAAHSDDNNKPETWGEDCTKEEFGGSIDTYELTQDYELVVVKSGSGEFANTLFADASEGETVWADTNGNSVFDEDDQGISHIIFCEGEEEETEEPSFEQSQEGETEEPSEEVTDAPSFEQSQEGDTEPPTNTIGGNGSSAPADSAWLLVVALGVLLASIVVLSPAKASTRR